MSALFPFHPKLVQFHHKKVYSFPMMGFLSLFLGTLSSPLRGGFFVFKILGLSLSIVLLTKPEPVWAVLGETIQESPGNEFSATSIKKQSLLAKTNYTIHTTTTEGLTLKEYADNAGLVFALSWQGVAHPDLSSLLGKYLSEYQTSVTRHQSTPGRRRSGIFPAHRVVVEKAGTIGRSRGRAYLPASIPKGVLLNEIQ